MDLRINVNDSVNTTRISEIDPAERVKAALRRIHVPFSENLNSDLSGLQTSVSKYLNKPLFEFLSTFIESALTNSDFATLLDEIKLVNSTEEPVASGTFSPEEPGTLPSIEKLKYFYNRQLLVNIERAMTSINTKRNSLMSQVDCRREMMMNLIAELEK